MTGRNRLAVILVAGTMALPTMSHAQGAPPARKPAPTMVAKWPDRAIRHDIPMTNMIQRAFAAGTRDSSGKPGKNYWQLYNDYTIEARLDSATHVITGHEVIRMRNTSPGPMTAIAMRLDQNVFAPNVKRNREITGETYGMKLTRLVVDGQVVDLAAPAGGGGRGGRGFGGGRGAGGAPDTMPAVPRVQASALGSTEFMITPAHPIASGATAVIEAEWNFEVPAPGARGLRMGRWGDTLYQVAQWYPQVAVYDDLRGWDMDPYMGDTEFYNNFGRFDVKIDVPAGWIVGATGYLQNPTEVLTPTARERLSHVLESDSQITIVGADERGPGKSTMPGSRLVWHFVADTVGDFAWGTSNQYVFDATRANIPGKGYIPYYLMYLAGHQNFRNQGAVGRHALEFYSKLWMPYAWNLETQVDGPEGGMEYPMFIMASGSTDHETGHQWWPMMVGVNETWYGFMDEGFNQYMNTLSNADRAAGRPVQPGFVNRLPAANAAGRGNAAGAAGAIGGGRGGAGGGGGRGGGCASRDMNPPGGVGLLNCTGQSFGAQSGDETYGYLMWDANYAGPRFQDQAYSRAPKMLSMLGGVVGDSAVWEAMSGYAKAWRFKHPSPWDYAFFMSNALHKDLGWFWYYWLYTTESVDGSIADVKSTGPVTTVTVHQAGQMPSPVMLAVEFAPTGPAIRQMANSKAIDSLTTLVTWPVDVWFNGSKTFKAALNFGGRKIVKITLDPYGRFPDKDVSDNVWPRE